jgi:hypothetical protein
VQAVAKKYFRDEQLTVAELDPQPLPAAPRPRSPFRPPPLRSPSMNPCQLRALLLACC